MLLSGLMRNVAITGNTDTINAWYGHSQAGRWAAQTMGGAMPTRRSEYDKGHALATLKELRARGVVSQEEYDRLRHREKL